jgi:hypothetical protein
MKALLISSLLFVGLAANAAVTLCGDITVTNCDPAPCYLSYSLVDANGATTIVDPVTDQAANFLSPVTYPNTVHACVTGDYDSRGHLEATSVQ